MIVEYYYNYKLINDAMSVGGEWSDDQTMLIQRTINQPLRRRCQDGILGPVTLTVGVVLGPVWGRYTNSRSGPRTSLGPVTLTVGVVLGPVWGLLH